MKPLVTPTTEEAAPPLAPTQSLAGIYYKVIAQEHGKDFANDVLQIAKALREKTPKKC